jgi:hypothetical protein
MFLDECMQMDPQAEWRAIFLDVVDDIGRQLDAEPVERGRHDGLPLEIELDVDGHVVDLFHDWSSGPNRITAHVRCGSIPEEGAAYALKRLLEAQHQADPCEGKSFGMDAETGELLFVTSMELNDLSGMELLARLRKTFRALAALRDGDTRAHAEGSMREVIFETFTS